MKRHCPRCGEPAAIVVTSMQHATRIGAISEEHWRCEACFKHFRLHGLKWDAFWLFFGAVFFGSGIATIAGLTPVKADQRVKVIAWLLVMGGAALAYGAHCVRLRKQAPLVRDGSGEQAR